MGSTKEQERKALEQIKGILAGLGNDSYIAAAIDPRVLALAADNINNDFLITTTSKIEAAEKREREATRALQDEKENVQKLIDKTIEQQAKIDGLTAKLANMTAERDRCMNNYAEAEEKAAEAEKRTEAANVEIIRLKAMLFDYMTKEG